MGIKKQRGVLVDRLNLSVRSANALKNENIHRLDELEFYSERHLLRIPNFGKVSLAEIKEICELHGIEIGKPALVKAREKVEEAEAERSRLKWEKRRVIDEANSKALAERGQARYDAQVKEARFKARKEGLTTDEWDKKFFQDYLRNEFFTSAQDIMWDMQTA